MWDLYTINRINQISAMLGRHPDFPVRDAMKLATNSRFRRQLEELERLDKQKETLQKAG